MVRPLYRWFAALATLCLFAAAPVGAQNWPTRPVRIVVPFAVGGPADNFARYLAQRLPEQLGQSFVVENRPGAGAVIGTDLVAKAPADGYTLLLMSNTHTVNETLVPNKPYNLMRDFVGVAPINYSDLVLVAHPSLPVANVQQLVRLAKERPGKLNYASSGTGTPYHMAGELFKSMSGTFLVHIPYKGSSGARTDLLGGQVDMMFDAVTTMSQMAKEGKVRALATTGLTRSVPELPTVAESVPKYEATIWLGLMAPKNTPPEVVNKLNAAVRKITADPEVKAAWAKQGAVPMTMTVAQFHDHLNQDIAKWAEIVKVSGAKPE